MHGYVLTWIPSLLPNIYNDLYVAHKETWVSPHTSLIKCKSYDEKGYSPYFWHWKMIVWWHIVAYVCLGLQTSIKDKLDKESHINVGSFKKKVLALKLDSIIDLYLMRETNVLAHKLYNLDLCLDYSSKNENRIE